MANSNITGRLLNAVRCTVPGGYYIEGELYEDVRHRWADGSVISTSKVVQEDGNMVLTLNSIYEVESWRDPATSV